MAFSICCLVLSGGVLAVEPVSPFSIVIYHNGSVSFSNVTWSVNSTGNSGDFGSFTVRTPQIGNGTTHRIWTGKQYTKVHAGNIINSRFGNVEQYCLVNDNTLSSVSGNISFTLGYYPRGDQATELLGWRQPIGWKCTVVDKNGTLYTKSGDGGVAHLNFTGLAGVHHVSLVWEFPEYSSFTVPDSFTGTDIFLWCSIQSNVRTASSGEEAEYQDDVVSGINESNSLLSRISNGISEVFNAISSLPGKIAEAIKGLFVPTDAQMEELKSSFNALLSEKLGFVYQAGSLVDGIFDAVFDAVDNPNSDVSFTVPAFPSFDVAGTEVSLWDDPVVVDIGDNEVVQTVQQVASPFVVAVMVWGFVHSMEDAFFAFVGGKSLFDWVRNRKEDTE